MVSALSPVDTVSSARKAKTAPPPSVVIIANVKSGGGADCRLARLITTFEIAGFSVNTLHPERRFVLRELPSKLIGLAKATVVPEVLAWDVGALVKALEVSAPDVVVTQTARSVGAPMYEGAWLLVVDFVDELSRSYLQRARSLWSTSSGRTTLPVVRALRPPMLVSWLIDLFRRSLSRRAKALGFAALALTHRRFERRIIRQDFTRLAAGAACSAALDGAWVPIPYDPKVGQVSGMSADGTSPEFTNDSELAHNSENTYHCEFARDAEFHHDPEIPYEVVFFGTLSYEPNVEACRHLDKVAKLVAERRGGVRLRVLIAGRHPHPTVKSICERNDWTLVEDYPSVAWLAGQAKVAVAPLQSAVGLQIKVLDAAALGIPQVVTEAVASGFGREFPLPKCADVDEFATELMLLLNNDDLASERNRLLRDFLMEHCSYAAAAKGLPLGLLSSVERSV